MDPMETVRRVVDYQEIVTLIEDNTETGQWLWVEDPVFPGIWAVMEGDTKVILAVVYTEDEDVEISDRLREMAG